MKKYEVTHGSIVSTMTEQELNKFLVSLGIGKLVWISKALAYRSVGVVLKGGTEQVHIRAI